MSLFLFRRFKCYLAFLDVFYEEDVLIVWGRLQVHKEHGGSQMVLRLSALGIGHPLPQEDSRY
jgi:hypothetical protein